tara:strand:+ start:100 stop:438 length:339 start_codon:yes stop_codon:yes gene_type:complete
MHIWKELIQWIDDELHSDYVMKTIRQLKVKLTKPPSDSLINELHDEMMNSIIKKLNDKYILLRRSDVRGVQFVEGATPPEGTVITWDEERKTFTEVDADADDFLTDPYPNNA